jgi:hypothetical protein
MTIQAPALLQDSGSSLNSSSNNLSIKEIPIISLPHNRNSFQSLVGKPFDSNEDVHHKRPSFAFAPTVEEDDKQSSLPRQPDQRDASPVAHDVFVALNDSASATGALGPPLSQDPSPLGAIIVSELPQSPLLLGTLGAELPQNASTSNTVAHIPSPMDTLGPQSEPYITIQQDSGSYYNLVDEIVERRESIYSVYEDALPHVISDPAPESKFQLLSLKENPVTAAAQQVSGHSVQETTRPLESNTPIQQTPAEYPREDKDHERETLSRPQESYSDQMGFGLASAIETKSILNEWWQQLVKKELPSQKRMRRYSTAFETPPAKHVRVRKPSFSEIEYETQLEQKCKQVSSRLHNFKLQIADEFFLKTSNQYEADTKVVTYAKRLMEQIQKEMKDWRAILGLQDRQVNKLVKEFETILREDYSYQGQAKEDDSTSKSIHTLYLKLHKSKMEVLLFEFEFVRAARFCVHLVDRRVTGSRLLENAVSDLVHSTVSNDFILSGEKVRHIEIQSAELMTDIEKNSAFLLQFPSAFSETIGKDVLQSCAAVVEKGKTRIRNLQQECSEHELVKNVTQLLQQFKSKLDSARQGAQQIQRLVANFATELLETRSIQSSSDNLTLDDELMNSTPHDTIEWLYERDRELNELSAKMVAQLKAANDIDARQVEELSAEVDEVISQISNSGRNSILANWHQQQKSWDGYQALLVKNQQQIQHLVSIVSIGIQLCECQMDLQEIFGSWSSWIFSQDNQKRSLSVQEQCQQDTQKILDQFHSLGQKKSHLLELRDCIEAKALHAVWLLDTEELAFSNYVGVVEKMSMDIVEVLPERWANRLKSNCELIVKCIHEEQHKLDTILANYETKDILQVSEAEKEQVLFTKKKESFSDKCQVTLNEWQEICQCLKERNQDDFEPSINAATLVLQRAVDSGMSKLETSSVSFRSKCYLVKALEPICELKQKLQALNNQFLMFADDDSKEAIFSLSDNADPDPHHPELECILESIANSYGKLEKELKNSVLNTIDFSSLTLECQNSVLNAHRTTSDDVSSAKNKAATVCLARLQSQRAQYAKAMEKRFRSLLSSLDSFKKSLYEFDVEKQMELGHIDSKAILDQFLGLEKRFTHFEHDVTDLNDIPLFTPYNAEDSHIDAVVPMNNLFGYIEQNVNENARLCALKSKVNEKWAIVSFKFEQLQKQAALAAALHVATELLSDFQDKARNGFKSLDSTIKDDKVWKTQIETLTAGLLKEYENIGENIKDVRQHQLVQRQAQAAHELVHKLRLDTYAARKTMQASTLSSSIEECLKGLGISDEPELNGIEKRLGECQVQTDKWKKDCAKLFHNKSQDYTELCQATHRGLSFKLAHVKDLVFQRSALQKERQGMVATMQQVDGILKKLMEIIQEEHQTQLSSISAANAGDVSVEKFLLNRHDWQELTSGLSQELRDVHSTCSKFVSMSPLHGTLERLHDSLFKCSATILNLGPFIFFHQKLLAQAEHVHRQSQAVIDEVNGQLVCLTKNHSIKGLQIASALEAWVSSMTGFHGLFNQIYSEQQYDALLVGLGVTKSYTKEKERAKQLIDQLDIGGYMSSSLDTIHEIQNVFTFVGRAYDHKSAEAMGNFKSTLVDHLYVMSEYGKLYQNMGLFQNIQWGLEEGIALTLQLVDEFTRIHEAKTVAMVMWRKVAEEKDGLERRAQRFAHSQSEVRRHLDIETLKSGASLHHFSQSKKQFRYLLEEFEGRFATFCKFDHDFFTPAERTQLNAWRVQFCQQLWVAKSNLERLQSFGESLKELASLFSDSLKLEMGLADMAQTLDGTTELSLTTAQSLHKDYPTRIHQKVFQFGEKLVSCLICEPTNDSYLILSPIQQLSQRLLRFEQKDKELEAAISTQLHALTMQRTLSTYLEKADAMLESVDAMKQAIKALDLYDPATRIFFEPIAEAYILMQKDWESAQESHELSPALTKQIPEPKRPHQVTQHVNGMGDVLRKTFIKFKRVQRRFSSYSRVHKKLTFLHAQCKSMEALKIKDYLASTAENKARLDESFAKHEAQFFLCTSEVSKVVSIMSKDRNLKKKVSSLLKLWNKCVDILQHIKKAWCSFQEEYECQMNINLTFKLMEELSSRYNKELRDKDATTVELAQLDSERETCRMYVDNLYSLYPDVLRQYSFIRQRHENAQHALFKLEHFSRKEYRKKDIYNTVDTLLSQLQASITQATDSASGFAAAAQEPNEEIRERGTQVLQELHEVTKSFSQTLNTLNRCSKHMKGKYIQERLEAGLKALIEECDGKSTEIRKQLHISRSAARRSRKRTASGSKVETPLQGHLLECQASFMLIVQHTEAALARLNEEYAQKESAATEQEQLFARRIQCVGEELDGMAVSLRQDYSGVLGQWGDLELRCRRRLADLEHEWETKQGAYRLATRLQFATDMQRLQDMFVDMELLVSILKLEAEGGLLQKIEQGQQVLDKLNGVAEKAVKIVDKYQKMKDQDVLDESAKQAGYLDYSLVQLSLVELDYPEIQQYHQFVTAPNRKLLEVSNAILNKFALLKRYVHQLECLVN